MPGMFYDVFTRHWGWEGNFHLPVPGRAVAGHTTDNGQARAPRQSQFRHLKMSLCQLISPTRSMFPTDKRSWHQVREITKIWRARAGVGWSLGRLFEPPARTCRTGKYPIPSHQLAEHSHLEPVSNRSIESSHHHISRHNQMRVSLGEISTGANGIQISGYLL